MYRAIMLLLTGLTATFGSDYLHLKGAGPLGCLTLAFVAGFRWREEIGPNDQVSYIIIIKHALQKNIRG